MKLIISASDSQLESLSNDPPEGVSIKPVPVDHSAHAMPPELSAVFSVIIDWSEPIAQGYIAAWIYDKLKDLKGLIKVNGKPCKDIKSLKNEIDNSINKKTKSEDE